MADAARLRVSVITESPLASWQRRAVDALRDVSDVARDARGHDVPDLVVDLANHPSVHRSSRLGTLRYGFADGAPFARGAVGTLARLYRTTDDGSVTTIEEGWFRGASDDGPGTAEVGERVAGWCARAVRRLAAGDAAALDGERAPMEACAASHPPEPQTPVVVRVRNEWRRWRRRERWTIGVVQAAAAEIIRRGAIPEPAWVTGIDDDRYVADPFPIGAERSTVHLLAEEYEYRQGRGRIVRLAIDKSGALLDRSDGFAADHHVAYPFVLIDGPNTFVIPDAAATGAIRAYAMPLGHAAALTLVDGFPGVDPTLVQHDGRWWLFCTHREQENQTELHLFFADDWRGPWQPHPLNPVKADARSSRPAGAMLVIDGELYRPAQDCSRRYGGALAINRIEQLTPTRFRERTILTLHPDPSWQWPDGLHTFNAIDDVVVVDGLRVER